MRAKKEREQNLSYKCPFEVVFQQLQCFKFLGTPTYPEAVHQFLLEVKTVIFVVLAKYRMKPSKETLDKSTKLFELMAKDGIRFIGQYWMLGKYDILSLAEAKDEKTMMKAVMRWGDLLSTQTMIAFPREEAIKLVE